MNRRCNCQNTNTNYCEEVNDCNCGYELTDLFGSNYMYGHAYVKNQIMSDVYCPRTALRNGTIFPELNMPYCPNQSLDVINYLKTANEIKEGCNS